MDEGTASDSESNEGESLGGSNELVDLESASGHERGEVVQYTVDEFLAPKLQPGRCSGVISDACSVLNDRWLQIIIKNENHYANIN
ncbi:hypothetical protein LIER_00193 [Lithospermum erythrorhizon]|uniref:Uncharacterized protein n=1 Tax=Lithospermum erythrorhizon TaxID=34254 RepID=A0AAV3NGL8_LITER